MRDSSQNLSCSGGEVTTPIGSKQHLKLLQKVPQEVWPVWPRCVWADPDKEKASSIPLAALDVHTSFVFNINPKQYGRIPGARTGNSWHIRHVLLYFSKNIQLALACSCDSISRLLTCLTLSKQILDSSKCWSDSGCKVRQAIIYLHGHPVYFQCTIFLADWGKKAES